MTSECATSPPFSRFLRKFEKFFTFLGRAARSGELLFSGGDREIVLHDGNDQAAASHFSLRFCGSGERGGAAIGRERSKIENLVHVALAYIFVRGIVGDKAHAIRIGLRIKRGGSEIHAGEERVAGLRAVFACDACLGDRSVIRGIVLARKVQGVLQRQPHGRARSGSRLRRWMRLAGSDLRLRRRRIGLLRGTKGAGVARAAATASKKMFCRDLLINGTLACVAWS